MWVHVPQHTRGNQGTAYGSWFSVHSLHVGSGDGTRVPWMSSTHSEPQSHDISLFRSISDPLMLTPQMWKATCVEVKSVDIFVVTQEFTFLVFCARGGGVLWGKPTKTAMCPSPLWGLFFLLLFFTIVCLWWNGSHEPRLAQNSQHREATNTGSCLSSPRAEIISVYHHTWPRSDHSKLGEWPISLTMQERSQTIRRNIHNHSFP